MAKNDQTQKRFSQIRVQLIKIREDIKNISTISADFRKPVTLDQQMVGRLSRIDAMQSQEMQLESERRRQIEIERVESALRRLKHGTFGNCVVCGEKIEIKRIKNDPTVPTCIKCAKT